MTFDLDKRAAKCCATTPIWSRDKVMLGVSVLRCPVCDNAAGVIGGDSLSVLGEWNDRLYCAPKTVEFHLDRSILGGSIQLHVRHLYYNNSLEIENPLTGVKLSGFFVLRHFSSVKETPYVTLNMPNGQRGFRAWWDEQFKPFMKGLKDHTRDYAPNYMTEGLWKEYTA